MIRSKWDLAKTELAGGIREQLLISRFPMVFWRVIVFTGRILMFSCFLHPWGILGREIILCHIITCPLTVPTVHSSFTGLFIMPSRDAGLFCAVSPLPPFLSLHKFLLQKQSLGRFLISEIFRVSWIASAFNRMLARNWVNANGVLEEEVLLQVYPHRYLRIWQEESIIHYFDRGIFLYWKKEVDAQEAVESGVIQPFLAIFFKP